MNAPLLRRLRDARGSFIPPADLGPDVEAVHRDLAELEAFGFAFEHHPYLGVAYRGPTDRLCPDQIECDLGTRRVGRRVAVWDRVASTNDLAARAAGSIANDGLVILAEEQTAGRGRRGRTWNAPPRASVLMSVLLFPPGPLDHPAWLTALGAVAVAEVVEAWTGRRARIKWPNDVRVDGRKIAGILVERGQGSVLGIGLNVNADAADLPDDLRDRATSLRILLGERADRSDVARALIERLDDHYDRGLTQGPAPLDPPWRDRFEPLGHPVRVETATATIVGRLVDVDLLRGLTLESADGRLGRVPADQVLALRRDDEPAPAG